MNMTLNCKGKLMDLSRPRIMGILNFTPDSFYDGGKYRSDKELLSQTENLLRAGADIIDVGAYSSRPKASFVTEEEELRRIDNVFSLLERGFPEAVFSVDTFRSKVAQVAIDKGAAMVNDISAGVLDHLMMDVVARARVPYVMMHLRGNPQTMASYTDYDDLVFEVIRYFSERVALARNKGINDLIIDPGFGFAKTVTQNYELLSKLDLLHELDLPILVGVSRKRMIYEPLDITPQEALNGTTVINTIALLKGAHILRVHDVREAQEVVMLMDYIKE